VLSPMASSWSLTIICGVKVSSTWSLTIKSSLLVSGNRVTGSGTFLLTSYVDINEFKDFISDSHLM
jgi:hypothetical protein